MPSSFGSWLHVPRHLSSTLLIRRVFITIDYMAIAFNRSVTWGIWKSITSRNNADALGTKGKIPKAHAISVATEMFEWHRNMIEPIISAIDMKIEDQRLFADMIEIELGSNHGRNGIYHAVLGK